MYSKTLLSPKAKSSPTKERVSLLSPMIVGSSRQAAERGHSLALIRPRNTRFIYQPKKPADIEEERQAYKLAADQTSMFDKELAQLEPSPYKFAFHFQDDDGPHTYQCGDWETHATFHLWRRKKSEAETLTLISEKFNDEYPSAGMVFAIGNLAKRQTTWQLLGIIRLDEAHRGELL